MMKHSSPFLLSIFLLGILSACGPQQSGEVVTPQGRSVIFFNGTILTMEETNPQVQAIAIQAGKIQAVGENDEILALSTEDTLIIDLEGRTLMPGFVDAHTHVLNDARSLEMSLDEAQALALQKGITTIGDLFVNQQFMNEIQQFANAGFLRLRTSLYLVYNDPCGQGFGDWYKDFLPTRVPGEMLRVNGVKIFVDGGSCGRPALSFEVQAGSGLGDLWMNQEELNRVVADAQAGGYQVALHAIGDRAVEQAQNSIAFVLDGQPNTYRHRMEHISVLKPEMIKRFGELGIVAVIPGQYHSCQPFGGPLPEDYREWEWPWRELRTANPEMKIAWHSDYPFWSISPFIHVYGFVTRNDVQLNYICQPGAWLRDDTLPVEEALSIMTIQSAYALFRENEVGSLAPGKYADLIILSANPLTIEAEELKNIHTLVTMVNGQFEYCLPENPQLCGDFSNRTPKPLPDTRPSEPIRWLTVILVVVLPLAGVALGRSRRDMLIRLAGAAGVLGGILWAVSFQLDDIYITVHAWLAILAVLCLLACMTGMWFLAKHTLVTRVALVVVGLTMIGYGESIIWIEWFRDEQVWVVMILSLLGQLLALIVFGIANLKTKLLPRFNWIPLAMGSLPLPTALLLSSVWLGSVNWQVLILGLILGAGWMVIGMLIFQSKEI